MKKKYINLNFSINKKFTIILIIFLLLFFSFYLYNNYFIKYEGKKNMGKEAKKKQSNLNSGLGNINSADARENANQNTNQNTIIPTNFD